MFPKLDKHCPFKAQLAEAMDGDLCTICNHQVHDLDAMTPETRAEFMQGSGKVCVRYRMPAALAAAALAASVASIPAAAQDAPPPQDQPQDQQPQDSVEFVGSWARPDPCRIVQTVRGRQIADVKRCARDQYEEKTWGRPPRTR